MNVPQTEIIVTKDGAEISRRIVTPGEYIIGREPDCDVRVEIDLVSRQHARLTVNAEFALIEDLGSSNGTRVNGKKVTESTRIWPNQKIQVGLATIELRRVKKESSRDDSLTPIESVVHKALPDEFLREKKYDIGGVIAQGGMGAILDAKEATTGRTVAMKVMLKTGSSRSVMRFIAEAKVTARLEHPNIVPVHELSVDENDQVFYTMKFVKGVTLRGVLEMLRDGDKATVAKYPLPALLTIFQKVCDALAFAHSHGVIHRDLKPENIMIGDYGEVLVMDWGLAKVGNEDRKTKNTDSLNRSAFVTMDGEVMGTPQYMSPEQARGEVETLDLRTDIYALGAILYHILALQAPVDGRNAMDVVGKVSRGETVPLMKAVANSKLRLMHLPGGRLPESLGAVVQKAMAFDSKARYPKVGGLQADITAYQNGFATGAENAGAGKQFILLIKRHKAVSIATVAGLVLLACITAAFTVRLLIEKNVAVSAKNVAEIERKRAEQSLGIADNERKRAEQSLGIADSERKRAESERKRAEAALTTAESERNRAEKALADFKAEHVRAETEHLTAETQRNRADQAATGLKNTAPNLIAMAKTMLNEGKYEAALEKIDYAIQGDSSNADYRLFRADLLESMGRLTDAVAEYHRVIAARPEDTDANMNMKLCERLLAENGGEAILRPVISKQLDDALRSQNRVAQLEAFETASPFPYQRLELRPQKTAEGILFQCYAPKANAVFLAGDFNNWANNKNSIISDKESLMKGPDAKGIWQKVVKLPSGNYHFKFNLEGRIKGWFAPDSIDNRDKDGNAAFTVSDTGEVEFAPSRSAHMVINNTEEALANRNSDLYINGVFGFPQKYAKILCDTPELRFSIYNNNEYLFAQAVVWNISTYDPDALDGSALVLGLGAYGAVVPNLDRIYQLHPRKPPALPSFGCLYFEIIKTNGGATSGGIHSSGRGAVRYVEVEQGRNVRVDTFLIPLSEISKRAGEAIFLCYGVRSLNAGVTANFAGSVKDGKYLLYYEIPRSEFNQYVLTSVGNIDLSKIPED